MPSIEPRVSTSSDRYQRSVLVVTLTGLFAAAFPFTILTLAIPTIAEDFGTEEAGLAWLVTLPMVGSALAVPVLGKLGDLYGHRRIFITGFAVATVLTALTATATNPAMLIGWRTLAQMAGASTMPCSLALINSVYRGRDRARAMGWWAMVSGGAPVVGLSIGAPAIDALGWQTLFLLQAALMVPAAAAAWLVLRETPTRRVRFDVPGTIALAAGVGPLLVGVSKARDWGVLSAGVGACVLASLLGLVAFVRVERKSAAPLIPLEFLRARASSSTLLVSLTSNAAYMGGFFLASLLLVEQFDYSLTSAVPILSIRPVLFAVMSPIGGRFAARTSARTAAVVGAATLTAGLVGLAVGSAIDSLIVVVLGGFILQGTGFGFLRPAITTSLADAVDDGDLGMAAASETLIGQLGNVVGITILATIYASATSRFPLAFSIGAVFGCFAVAFAARMVRGRTRSHVVDETVPTVAIDEPDAAPIQSTSSTTPVVG